jgi:hypothetical protein
LAEQLVREHKACIEMEDQYGKTRAYYAAMYQHKECLEVCNSLGARTSFTIFERIDDEVDIEDGSGFEDSEES